MSDILFLGGIEVQKMEWEWVEVGLEAAKKAGIRPSVNQDHFPDYVYAYTKWTKNRLNGRDISLLSYVKSRCSGSATFRCCNGHEWKTWVRNVASGEGCPTCGIGDRSSEEMIHVSKPANLLLLINADKPGFFKITLTYQTNNDYYEENINNGWVIHRHRDVEEHPELAESLVWGLLGVTKPKDGVEIEIERDVAEQAFRNLIYRLRENIALLEKEKLENK